MLSSLMLQKKGICRSISYENPHGEKGKAAWTSSVLGPSRKGTPFLLNLPSGETFTLAEIEGTGVIRQFFITVTDQKEAGPGVLQKLILRMYWENEEVPSVECPLGEFFCCGHNEITMLGTDPAAVVPARSFHWYFPMAFEKHVKITLENTYGAAISVVAYQVTYTVENEEGKATESRYSAERNYDIINKNVMAQSIERESAHFHASYIKGKWNQEDREVMLIPAASDISGIRKSADVGINANRTVLHGTQECDGKLQNSGVYVGTYISARQCGKKCRKEFLLRLEDNSGNIWYEPVDGDQLADGGWHSFRIQNAVRFEEGLRISLIPWDCDMGKAANAEDMEAEIYKEEVDELEKLEISGAVYWYC